MVAVTSEYFGGNPPVFGGVDNTPEYSESRSQDHRNKLIRNIAQDLKNILSHSQINPNAPINSVIAQLKKLLSTLKNQYIPDGTAGAQNKVCNAFAESLNKRYNAIMINMDDPPKAICKKVGEVIHTLFTGQYNEFIAIAGDVQRTLNNINLLREHLKSTHVNIISKINESDDDTLKLEASNIDAYYRNLTTELDRHHGILSNIMGVIIDPITGDLTSMLTSNKAFTGFVEELEDDLGSINFGIKLSRLLAGVNQVAQIAHVVNEALKKIGMSVKDYKNTKGVANLRLKIYEHLMAKGDSITARDIQTFLKAAEIIYKNDYAHDNIVKYLETHRGGKIGGNETQGGVSERVKNKLSYRMKQQKKYRRIMFKDFEKRLQPYYNRILNSVLNIAPSLGNEIPADNDDLKDFVSEFKNIINVDQENMHIILSGYLNRAYAKDQRNKFIETLNSLSKKLSPLISGPKGDQFRIIKDSIDHLVKIIDEFKEKFLKALTAVAIESRGVSEKGLVSAYGADEDFDGGKINIAKLKAKAKKAAAKVKDDPRVKKSVSKLEDAGTGLVATGIDLTAEKVAQKSAQVQESMTNIVPEELKESEGSLESMIGRADNIEMTDMAHIDTEFPAPLENVQIDMYQGVGTTDPATSLDDLMEHDVMASSLSHTYPDHVGHGEFIGGSTGVEGYATFARASRDLDYYLSIAKIKQNLKNVSAELADIDENYITILGNAAAGLVENSMKHYTTMFNSIGSHVSTISETTTTGDFDPLLRKAFKFLIDGDGKATPADSQKWREVKSHSLEFAKESYEAKKDLIEVAQAIDLYMKAFAQAIVKNPNAVKSINAMLESVTIVVKFFSESTGDIIAKLYEELPVEHVGDADKFEGDTVIINNVKTPVGEIYTGLATSSGWKLGITENDHYYEKLKKTTKNGGHPFKAFLLTSDKYKAIELQTKLAMKGLRVLDNIISTCFTLGDSVINKTSASQTFMSSGQIFNKLTNYMTWNTWTQGFISPPNSDHIISNDLDYNDYKHIYPNEEAFETIASMGAWTSEEQPDDEQNTSTLTVGEGYKNDNRKYYAAYVRKQCGIAMSSIAKSNPYSDKQVSASEFNINQNTDRLFELCIKSLTVKPFIILNVYKIFNHPTMIDHPFRPVRTILGGADKPKIIIGAFELYFRLVLMAEWYRDLFKFGIHKEDDLPQIERAQFDRAEDLEDGMSGWKKISMVPESDVIWSGLIRLVFDEAKYVKYGTYSDAQFDTIVREVNSIFNKIGSVSAVLSGFRDEINRRYGIVNQKDINDFIEERHKQQDAYKDSDLIERDRVDQFDILDAEDQKESGTLPAPSDRFMSMRNIARGDRKDIFTWKFHELLTNFRNNIDENLAETTPANIRTSFYQSIRQHKEDLKRATNEEEKYNIVRRAVQGIDKLSGVHSHKLLLFHEMVSVPLATLYHLYCSLKFYNDTINMFNVDVLKQAINDSAKAGAISFDDFETGANSFNSKWNDQWKNHQPMVDFDKFGNNYFKTTTSQVNPELLQEMKNMGQAMPGADTLSSAEQFEGTPNQRQSAAVAYRYGIDWHKIFRTISQLVWSMGDSLNGLVHVRQEGKKILVDYSKLQDHVEALLNNVRKTLNTFRGVIPQNVLERFEDGKHIGSVYWLEENFIDILFKNRYSDGLPQTTEIINGVFNQIIGSINDKGILYSKVELNNYDAGKAIYKSDAVLKLVNPGKNSDLSMEREFAKMIYWDALSPNMFTEPDNKSITWSGFNQYPFSLLPLFELDTEPTDAKEREDAVAFKKYMESVGTASVSLAKAQAVERTLISAANEIRNIDVNLQRLSYGLAQTSDNTAMSWNVLIDNNKVQNDWSEALDGVLKSPIDAAGINKYIHDTLNMANFIGNMNVPSNIKEHLTKIKSNTVNSLEELQKDNLTLEARMKGAKLFDKRQTGYDGLVVSGEDSVRLDNRTEYIEATTSAGTDVTSAQTLIDTTSEGKKALLAQFNFPFKERANWYNVNSNNYSSETVKAPHGLYKDKDVKASYISEFDSETYATDYGSWDTPFKGLVVRFNETIAKYVQSFYDTAVKKIYLPLIEKFSTGNQNAAVMHGKAINDLVFQDVVRTGTDANEWYGSDYFRVGDPKPNVVLFASIARTLKTLIQSTDKSTKQRKYAADSLGDLPYHLREKMKCNLPIFITLFEQIIHRAEFIKMLLAMRFPTTRIINRHHVESLSDDIKGANVNIRNDPGDGKVIKHDGNFPYDNELDGEKYRDFNRAGRELFEKYDKYDVGVNGDYKAGEGRIDKSSYFKRYLDSIISATQSIQLSARKVYRELEDAPLYLELNEDSMSNYIQRYNRNPVMPHSTMSWVLRPPNDMKLTAGDNSVLMPGYDVGEDQFKFNYGTRGVLQRWDLKPVLDNFPGMKEILHNYNGISNVRSQMDSGHFSQMVGLNTLLLRYIGYNKFYKKMLGGHVMFAIPQAHVVSGSAGNFVYTWRPNAIIYPNKLSLEHCDHPDNQKEDVSTCKDVAPLPLAYFNPGGNAGEAPVYSGNKATLADLLALTETSFVQENIKRITDLIKPGGPELDSRKIIRKINIIDIGVPPINVHKMQQEMAFANLMNYGYTYDRMMMDILVPQSGIYANNRIPPTNAKWEPRTTAEAMAKLCIHPYGELSINEYYGWLKRIVTGDSGLDLGRPRFLGDQLYNKVMFQELYAVPANKDNFHAHFPDEGGPRVDSVAWRVRGEYKQETGDILLGTDVPSSYTPGTGANLTSRYTDDERHPAGHITFPPSIKTSPWSRKQMYKETSLARANLEDEKNKIDYPDDYPKNQASFSGPLRKRYGSEGVDTTKHSMVQSVNLGADGALRNSVDALGRLRFDTVLLRNLWWLPSLQRISRMIFRNEANFIESPVVSKSKILNKSITEYGQTDKWSRLEDTDAINIF